MRIYNGKDSLVCLPLNANQRISIDPHSVSGDFLPSTEFITTVISAYDTNELALIVASSFEINICANIVGAVNYVVQSLDEAISRFAIPKEEKKEEAKEVEEKKPKVEPVIEPLEDIEECPCNECKGKGCESEPKEEPQEEKVEEEVITEDKPQPKKKGRKKSKD